MRAALTASRARSETLQFSSTSLAAIDAASATAAALLLAPTFSSHSLTAVAAAAAAALAFTDNSYFSFISSRRFCVSRALSSSVFRARSAAAVHSATGSLANASVRALTGVHSTIVTFLPRSTGSFNASTESAASGVTTKIVGPYKSPFTAPRRILRSEPVPTSASRCVLLHPTGIPVTSSSTGPILGIVLRDVCVVAGASDVSSSS